MTGSERESILSLVVTDRSMSKGGETMALVETGNSIQITDTVLHYKWILD
jgi:hypothetical protein